MFDAEVFIDKTRNDIANDRDKAGWWKFASYALKFVTVAVVITGVIESFARAEFSNMPFRIIPDIGASAWNWMNDNVPLLWAFLRLICIRLANYTVGGVAGFGGSVSGRPGGGREFGDTTDWKITQPG